MNEWLHTSPGSADHDTERHDAAVLVLLDHSAIEVISKPSLVQRYLDEGFIEYGDGRTSFYDPQTDCVVILGERDQATPGE